MGEIIGPLIFIVVAIFALAKKLQEQRAQADKQRPEEAPRARGDLPDTTRQMLYGEEKVRQARPAEPRTARPRVDEPLTPGRVIMESLLGGPAPEEAEGGWVPVQEPAQRRELPGTGQEPSAPQRRIVEVQRPALREAQRTPVGPERRPPQLPRVAAPQQPAEEQQRRLEEVRRRRATASQARRRQAQPRKKPRRARPRPSPRSLFLWGDLRGVRKAIVLAEILGPPKSLQ